jgi:hypothetical protein
VEAISALVRIAVAARDELPSAADVECLWGAAPRDSESRWAAFEALVALARWPESGVSAASLRPMLESLRDSRENSVRERVERLLARLPR